MELRHLRYFIAVAEERNFHRAADRLHMAQPPLSLQIRQLEEELGVSLLDRRERPLRLTGAGELVLAQARHVLREAEAVLEIAQRAAHGRAGRLRVALCSSAPYSPAPEMLRQLRREAPELELQIMERRSELQVAMLQEGQLDVGVVRLPLAVPAPGLRFQTIRREGLVAALPARHRLRAKKMLVLRELAGEDFICFPEGAAPALYGQIQAACRNSGFSPRITQHATQMQTIVALVATGLGVALLPEAMRGLRQRGVEYRSLRAPLPQSEIAFAWCEGRETPVLSRLLGMQ